MVSDQDMQDFYSRGTKNNADKWEKKTIAAASKTLSRLQSDETAEGWSTNVSSEQAKKRYKKKVGNLKESDITDAIKDGGKSAYSAKTGTETTAKKWLKNTKPYIEVAQEFSNEKKVITSDADREYNMLENMRRMMAKKEELDR